MVRTSPATPKALFKTPRGKGTPKSASKEAQDSECPLVKHIPEIVKTGDDVEDITREDERKAFITVVQHMWKDRSLINPTKAFVLRTVANKQNDVSVVAAFEGKVVTLQKLPVEWVAAWLVKHIGGNITLACLDLAKCKDNDIVYRLLGIVVGLPLTTVIPDEFREHVVVSHYFVSRMNLLGRQIQVRDSMKADGTYDKATGSPYTLVWDDSTGLLSRLVYSNGATSDIPAHIPIDRTWKVSAWYDDVACTIGKPPLSHALRSFFAKGQGPHSFAVIKKKFIEDLTAAKAAVSDPASAARTAAEVAVPEGDVFEKANAQRSKENSDKAREVLEKFRERKRKASEVSLV
uniref:Uncharacterized protein n=1 Tax=Zooxanthella nutricula TaxID=1333877 RepID=A0A7S2QMU7_9DINO